MAELKKTTVLSKSSGVPHLPAGILSNIALLLTASFLSASVFLVATYAGTMPFTFTPLDAHSMA